MTFDPVTRVLTEQLGARVFANAAQSIPNATATALNFNLERFDTGNFHDNVTNNTRLTIPAAGIYLAVANASFTANAVSYRWIGIRLGGGTMLNQVSEPNPSTAMETILTVSTIWQFAAGEYIEAIVAQNSGAPLNIITAVELSPSFAIARVG